MSLAEYSKKRDFKKTKEPKGSPARLGLSGSGKRRYVIQKHDARQLHYDLRLEHNGVLLSWAIPKGPSLDPSDKRLAVRVEDHPLGYASFEGTIPKGEYGAGTVMVWDIGTWEPLDEDISKGLKNGKLGMRIEGSKLRGEWHLNRMKRSSDDDKENWLLVKAKDDDAVKEMGDQILKKLDTSVLSGRSLSEIEKAKPSTQNVKPGNLTKSKSRKTLPSEVSPQLATLVDSAPEGDDWLHEIKYDGYRLLAFSNGTDVKLKTRNDKDWTDKFPDVAASLSGLKLDRCILDGELVATGKDGVSDFQTLQGVLKNKKRSVKLTYMAFDALYAFGNDLRASPLRERKRLLRSLVGHLTEESQIRFSDHVIGDGKSVFENACKLKLEGIISKKTESAYSSKRNRNWLKVKCERRQEFVIGGMTAPQGSRSGFGALLLGSYQDGKLMFNGKVGTGFDESQLKKLHDQLAKDKRKTCPFSAPPSVSGAVTWLRPRHVAEIKFTEATSDRRLRHPSFISLRSDKDPKEVTWESPSDDPKPPNSKSKTSQKPARQNDPNSKRQVASVALTHPDRVLYPEIEGTKTELAEYYEAIAPHMLPYVADRPLALLRHPSGWKKDGFFQKHLDDSFPSAIKHVEIEEKNGTNSYGYVTDASGLVGLLQMGTLEFHAWGSKVDKVDRPDTIIFDLDPHEDVSQKQILGAALLLRDLLLEDADLKSFLKATGGKGLHVVAPIIRGPSWDDVKSFAKGFANHLKDQNRDAFTTTASKSKRKGKIYVDYLRNGRGSTAIVPYSTRARKNAPVAVPLSWDEVNHDTRSNHYTVRNVLRRVAHLKTDPWDDFQATRQRLTKSLLKDFA